jgi:hypothetical protein
MQSVWLAAALVLSAPGPRAAGSLRPLWSSSGSYGESFTFIADLEDGSYVQATLSLTNLGPGSTKAICRAMVVPRGGRPWKASERFSSKGWGYRAGPDGAGERLTIGPCAAWSAETSGVEVPLDGGRVLVRFAGPLRPMFPPAVAVQVGEHRFGAEVLLYRVAAEAEIELPGEEPRRLAGSGYADHSRGTVPPRDLARRWIRFRGLRGERGLLLLGREALDGTYSPLWASDGTGHRDEYQSVRLERGGARESPAFRIEVQGEAGPMSIRSGTLLYRDAPVEDLGFLGKLVAPFLGSPVTYVYRALATEEGGESVEGILEVELSPEE